MMNRYIKAALLTIIFVCHETSSIDPFHALLIPAGIATMFVMYKQQQSINSLTNQLSQQQQNLNSLNKDLFKKLEKLQRIKRTIIDRISCELFLHSSLSDSFAHYVQKKNAEVLELQELCERIEKKVNTFKKQNNKNNSYNVLLERVLFTKFNLIYAISWYRFFSSMSAQPCSFSTFWDCYAKIYTHIKILFPALYKRFGIYEISDQQESSSFYTDADGMRDLAKKYFNTIIGEIKNDG